MFWRIALWKLPSIYGIRHGWHWKKTFFFSFAVKKLLQKYLRVNSLIFIRPFSPRHTMEVLDVLRWANTCEYQIRKINTHETCSGIFILDFEQVLTLRSFDTPLPQALI